MTFRIKVRGARGPIVAEYLCPVHGRFEATIDRTPEGNAPDLAPCPRLWRDPPTDGYRSAERSLLADRMGADEEAELRALSDERTVDDALLRIRGRKGRVQSAVSTPAAPDIPCLMKSPWVPSAPNVKIKLTSAVRQGGAEKSPHETALDTRDLGEGMPLNEWRKKRAKMWRERDWKRYRKTGMADRMWNVLHRAGESTEG